jgi:hypothetical protein
MCMPRQICVQRSSGIGIQYTCADNPCGTDKPLSCMCAASLCPAGNVCGVSGSTLSCSCPQCV